MLDILKEAYDVLRSGFIAVAFAGALAAESFWPASSRMRTVANVGVGTMISCTTAPLLSYLVVRTWPDMLAEIPALNGAIYFWLGLLGMQIVPVAAMMIRSVRTPWTNGGQ